MTDHFNQLSASEAEALALIAEEAAEIVLAVTKTLRHGLGSTHPDDPDGEDNRQMIEREIGDLRAVVDIALSKKMFSATKIEAARKAKLRRVRQYLHHVRFPLGELLQLSGGPYRTTPAPITVDALCFAMRDEKVIFGDDPSGEYERAKRILNAALASVAQAAGSVEP